MLAKSGDHVIQSVRTYVNTVMPSVVAKQSSETVDDRNLKLDIKEEYKDH